MEDLGKILRERNWEKLLNFLKDSTEANDLVLYENEVIRLQEESGRK